VRKAPAKKLLAAKQPPAKKAARKRALPGRKTTVKKITAEDTLKLFLRTYSKF